MRGALSMLALRGSRQTAAHDPDQDPRARTCSKVPPSRGFRTVAPDAPRGRHMKLGMLHLFENPIGYTEHQVVKNQLELMVEAERLGYDSVWPAEHHFSEYGYCASPQVSLAAVAARTSKIRLGTGVVILPFHHPVRVAEDFAFIDLMSDGRVDLGVGRGYQPMEYRGFGLDQSQSREMFLESLDVIKKCWTLDRFSHKGRYYQFDDICVRPKPLQQPHPPVYMACLSPGTFETAGRLGYDVLVSTVFGLTAEGARQGIADYRRGRQEAGLDPKGGKIACLVMVYPGKTREQARNTFGPRDTGTTAPSQVHRAAQARPTWPVTKAMARRAISRPVSISRTSSTAPRWSAAKPSTASRSWSTWAVISASTNCCAGRASVASKTTRSCRPWNCSAPTCCRRYARQACRAPPDTALPARAGVTLALAWSSPRAPYPRSMRYSDSLDAPA
ncbi:MAG: LLM class flavin-dependent oxidoreductase [Proteobacteria bacterium]|nr:LLM class flavin-dependent oxidoreductase [Pseudomonadota bacterium]